MFQLCTFLLTLSIISGLQQAVDFRGLNHESGQQTILQFFLLNNNNRNSKGGYIPFVLNSIVELCDANRLLTKGSFSVRQIIA